jgi:hypothetical protein
MLRRAYETGETTTMTHREPICTAEADTPRRAGRVLGLALAAALLLGGTALAGPAAEYGPEAEASFLALCASPSGASPAECRCTMERLQDELGYADFLDAAGGGPAAFVDAAGRRLAGALRRASNACTAQAALPAADP